MAEPEQVAQDAVMWLDLPLPSPRGMTQRLSPVPLSPVLPFPVTEAMV